MIPLNYHHLYYFWTVARAGSIAAATERLYLSQPALSGQLKQLETACKARLLERGRRGVSLTFEGRAVFERCERIFSEGEELAALIRSGFEAPPALRLGAEPAVSREVILRVVEFVRREDAACRVEIRTGDVDALSAKLRRGTVDLIVAGEDCARGLGSEYRGRLVAELPVFFVANRAVRRIVRRFPAGLENTGLLLRPPESAVRKQVEYYLLRRRVRYRVEAESEDMALLRRLAAEGLGAAALNALAVEEDLKARRLCVLHSAPVGIREAIWFACEARPRANPALRALLEGLMENFTIFGRAPAVRSALGR